jgi:XRE family transcriptional regulator, regulator of sulfur utilization
MTQINAQASLPKMLSRPNPPALGAHIQQLRKRGNLTLDVLAKLSGVSKSMLSQIERGQTNPTIGTVWALAEALAVDVSELIDVRKTDRRIRIDVSQPSYVPEIRSEDGLCVMRILSPADKTGALEWYELTFAPSGRLNSEPHTRGTAEHLSVLEGELSVTADNQQSIVQAGGVARYPADVAHRIDNLSSKPARALLVVLF